MTDKFSTKLAIDSLFLEGATYFLLLRVLQVENSGPEAAAENLAEFLLHLPTASPFLDPAAANMPLNFLLLLQDVLF